MSTESEHRRMLTIIRDESVEDLLGRATMRPVEELVDMLDLVENYHHAVRQTMEDRAAPPPACHPDVVAERLHALRWLLVQTDAAWDEISLDS